MPLNVKDGQFCSLGLNKNRNSEQNIHVNYYRPCSHIKQQMSLYMKKPTICICENKDADQLRGNREADQRLCFRYTDRTLSLLLKSKISNF